MDIDASVKNIDFTKENIIKIVKEIINIDINDNAVIEICNVSTIRDDDEYGGYRITLTVKIENMKDRFQIDIATGDPITPKAIVYKYKPILGIEFINLWAYNIETVLAEKLETILKRAEASSRIRDYYDIYLIYTKDWASIYKDYFRKAVDKTFTKRQYNGNIIKTFELISNSEILKLKWD